MKHKHKKHQHRKIQRIPTGSVLEVLKDTTKYEYTSKGNYYREEVRRTPYEALCHFIYIYERQFILLLLFAITSILSISGYVFIPIFIQHPETLKELIHQFI